MFCDIFICFTMVPVALCKNMNRKPDLPAKMWIQKIITNFFLTNKNTKETWNDNNELIKIYQWITVKIIEGT